MTQAPNLISFLSDFADFPSKEAVFDQYIKDINNSTIIIGTIQNAPFSYAEKENDTWVGKGVAFDFVNYLQQKYKFSYTVVVEEEIFGPNNTGLYGLLNNGVSKQFIRCNSYKVLMTLKKVLTTFKQVLASSKKC